MRIRWCFTEGWHNDSREFECDDECDVRTLIPETVVQAITDAYSDAAKVVIRGMWPSLAVAIEDALTEEDNDMMQRQCDICDNRVPLQYITELKLGIFACGDCTGLDALAEENKT